MPLSAAPLKVLGALAVAWLSYQWYLFRSTEAKISHIPTVGSDGFISSYLGAWKYFIFGDKIIEGFKKYKGGVFKVPTFETATGWLIVVSGETLINEVRKAGDRDLDPVGGVVDLLHIDHTFGKRIAEAKTYHIGVTRKQLTKNTPALIPALVEEMREAFKDYIPASEEWAEYSPLDTFLNVVCRDPKFTKLQTTFAPRLMITATLIGLFPKFMRPLAGRLVSPVPRVIKEMESFLGPTIEERLKKDEELGTTWEGRPNDLISWLLESAPPDQRDINELVVRIMFTEFASLHTTTITWTDAILSLAARPEYVEPLREEVSAAIAEHGWTMDAFDSMVKLDSFLKESARMAGASSVGFPRKAVRDFTLSNGVKVPAGYTVGCITYAGHIDSPLFENSDTFDGFRFSKTVDAPEYKLRNEMVSPDSKVLTFGGGRHMCPGRFFAVAEIKALTCHILLEYDVRLPEGTVFPNFQCFGSARVPHSATKIQFRRRRKGSATA